MAFQMDSRIPAYCEDNVLGRMRDVPASSSQTSMKSTCTCEKTVRISTYVDM